MSAFLLMLAYLLLVLVTVFGAFWIQGQFDEAEQERCDMLAIQIRLAGLEVVILQASNPPPPADVQAQIDNRVDTLRDRIKSACPDTQLP